MKVAEQEFMSRVESVPFNDLRRIHNPLLNQFHDAFERVVLNSKLVLGEEVSNFEEDLAFAEGCNYVVGVNSGTSAIELALRALGIGKSDEVITSNFTFVATCFSIIQTGATPVVVDVNPATGLIEPMQIQKAISPKTKAVVFVTLHGRVDYLEEIAFICRENNIAFVIDAAQSHLGTFKGLPQSSYADVTTLSFYPGKNLGALGEGGAILTNSQDIYKKVLLMRDWGANEKYHHNEWGGNFRLETIQASFLRIKLSHLKDWTIERQKIAERYSEEIESQALLDLGSVHGCHVYHIYAIRTSNREKLCEVLRENSVEFGFHYPKTIHSQKAYSQRIQIGGSLKNSEELAKSILSIPIFPGQTEEEIEKVVKTVNCGLRLVKY